MAMIKARIPGKQCTWSYETHATVDDMDRWLEFLRHRGFTEVLTLVEDIPPVLKYPSGAECTRGWFLEDD